ncbi:integration host factor, actinobacterial type [Hugonella massiliensis]|uniref:integration host factor, actinobacterial type n=1 Tax=Hugonella massiliensis TaxID=1720315 RepID=UPI00073E6AC6|nr:integration host factor, actinobacterial type [Hugonella massiliensis]MDD6730577.1 integration host factor, actinobacterial type [Eggerthellaceae bacterium]
MALPQMTEEQRAEALKKAAETRARRAEYKQQIKDGKLSCADAFGKLDDSALAKMRVKQFVSAFPGYGKAKTESLLAEVGIDETRRLAGLGDRQKTSLIEALDK